MSDNETPQQPVDPEPPTATPEPENMEVHYEPHFKHGHHKKHIKEYAKEFLMIFFAVFLGFLAESLREHISERGKEKEYVRGFLADLKKDSIEMRIKMKTDENFREIADSIYYQSYTDLSRNENRIKLYHFIRRSFINYIPFTANDITLQQVRSTGGLALLNKRSASEKILQYYADQERSNSLQKVFISDFNNFVESATEAMDLRPLRKHVFDERPDTLPTVNNSIQLRKFFNEILANSGQLRVYDLNVAENQKENTKLRNFLKDTYHLKED